MMFSCANRILVVLFILSAVSGMAQSFRVLYARTLHLRSGDVPEWDWFAGKTPDGTRYDLEFEAGRNATEASLWIDGDGDDRFTTAREYARRLIAVHGLNVPELIRALDASAPGVAAQVAGFCHASGMDLKSQEVATALAGGSGDVRSGFESFLQALP